MAISARFPYFSFVLVTIGVIHSTASSTNSNVHADALVRNAKMKVNIDAQGPVEVNAIVASESSFEEEDIGTSTGENCGGSMSVDPRYCVSSVVVSRGEKSAYSTCSNMKLKEGNMVPLRIRVNNKANFENLNGDTVYIPSKIPAGKRFQIVFACSNTTCKEASGDALEFVSFESDSAQDSSFTAGPAPGFTGINKCSGLSNANTACGYITIGHDIHIEGDGRADLGIVMMKAVKKVSGNFVAYVASDAGALMTIGGICRPNELGAAGSGTCSAAFDV